MTNPNLFQKIIKKLKKTFKKSQNRHNYSLNHTHRLRYLRFKVWLRGYFVGLFLVPWVFVWGAWLFLSGLIVYLINTDYITFVTYRNSLPYPIAGFPKGQNYEFLFIWILGLVLLINYSISFFSYRKNMALGVLMCILSAWILLMAYFYLSLVWKFNANLLG